MSKVKINRRGPSGNADRVTLSHLRPGETFRFPRSRPGTVYQVVTVSDRTREEEGLEDAGEFMFSNVQTGQLFVTNDSRPVVPVTCSVTVRERQSRTKPVKAKARASTRSTSVRTKSRSRR